MQRQQTAAGRTWSVRECVQSVQIITEAEVGVIPRTVLPSYAGAPNARATGGRLALHARDGASGETSPSKRSL